MGLLSFLTGCLTEDRYPDMPMLPQLDNPAIRVDSLANTTVIDFLFSADKTKFYAVVLTSSTGVSAQHTLVEFDQTGHRLRALPLGALAIIPTELGLLPDQLLQWRYANVFYIIDLQQFRVRIEVPIYSVGNYPEVDQDRERVTQKSEAWFDQKRQELNQKFEVKKFDSVSNAILEGNKTNDNAYQTAVRTARSDQSQVEFDWHQHDYEAYARRRFKTAVSAFGYHSPLGFAACLVFNFPDGRSAAFELDSATIRKSGVTFITSDVNPTVALGLRNVRYTSAVDQTLSDRPISLRVTAQVITKYNSLRLNGLKNERLLYYELKIGPETAHFKWTFPVQASDDFYLQSANGSVFVLQTGVLYWFQAPKK